MIGVNLWGVVHGIRAFLPHLLGRRPHRQHGLDRRACSPGSAPSYDATKHAVVAISEDLLQRPAHRRAARRRQRAVPGLGPHRIVDAERNWPARPGRRCPTPAGDRRHRHTSAAPSTRAPRPASIADAVADAVVAGPFWVIPHARLPRPRRQALARHRRRVGARARRAAPRHAAPQPIDRRDHGGDGGGERLSRVTNERLDVKKYRT